MRPGERPQRPDFCSTGLPLCPGFAGLRPITFALLLTSCLSSCADRTPPIGRDLGSTDARSDLSTRAGSISDWLGRTATADRAWEGRFPGPGWDCHVAALSAAGPIQIRRGLQCRSVSLQVKLDDSMECRQRQDHGHRRRLSANLSVNAVQLHGHRCLPEPAHDHAQQALQCPVAD
jgi:hypothetical protein